MRYTHLCTALLATALAGGAGCIFVDHDREVRITELEVTGETDWGLLDVEVHLFDADTHQHLGCAGAAEGLERVDEDDVMYHVDAWFRAPYADVAIEPWELDGRALELQVIEDDVGVCPEPPSIEDDMIGISPPVDRAMFEVGPMLSFDRVMGIRVVID